MITLTNTSARRRSRFAAMLAATALLAAGLVVIPASQSEAIVASGGVGRFTDSIQWIQWAGHDVVISDAGQTTTETFVTGGHTVAVTCSVSNIASDGPAGEADHLRGYRPGTWRGDGLDELYNISGTGNSNDLVVGLSNNNNARDVTFDFSCSATIDGSPLPLAGLVFADAEQSGEPDEHVAATAPAGATWRIIDRYRSPGCTFSTQATLVANRLTLFGDSEGCLDPPGPFADGGPATVAFLQGATSATNVSVKGHGRSAIALGVMISVEHGDAPATYGDPVHVIQSTWNGGTGIGTTPTEISEPSFGLASRNPPPLRLGALVDSEDPARFSANATGDDTAGVDDDDSLVPAPSRAFVLPNATYTKSSITCAGTGVVSGWIDWDRNGVFDADEKSTNSPCAGGTASVTWTVTSDVVTSISPTSFLRLRIGPDAASVATATSLALAGETEDYSLEVEVPRPVMTPDSWTTQQNTPTAAMNPSANDSAHAQGGALVANSVRLMDGATPVTSLAVAGGTYSVDPATGNVTFTPAQGFRNGTAVVTYRVTDSNGQTNTSTISTFVSPVGPTANPDSANTTQGQSVSINVADDDTAGNPNTSLDLNSITLAATVIPGEGTFQVDGGGFVTFTPLASFVGTSSVNYTIADEDGTTSTSTITVTVAAVGPQAVADVRATQQNTPVSLFPGANDQPGVAGGTPIDAVSARLIDPLTDDPTTAVTLVGVGTFTVDTATGQVTFQPAPGFTGAAVVGYEISDTGGLTDRSTITINVSGVTPQASPDTGTTSQDANVTVDPLANDQAGNLLTPLVPGSVVLTPGASGGVVSNGGKTLTVASQGVYSVDPITGQVTFNPFASFSGTALAVGYTVLDSDDQPASSTITITVTPVGPIASPDAASTEQATPVSVPVLGNDDPGVSGGTPLDPTSLRLVGAGGVLVTSLSIAEGQVSVVSGSIRFEPAPSFVGAVPLVTYSIADEAGLRDEATIAITVTADPPTASPDTASTAQGVPVDLSPLDNDVVGNSNLPFVPSSLMLSLAGVTSDGKSLTVPGEGVYTVETDGTVRFAPLPAFVGEATTITYTVEDDGDNSATSTISVTVAPSQMTAADDTGGGAAGDPILTEPLENDSAGPGSFVPSSLRLIGPTSGPSFTLSDDGRTLVVAGEGSYSVDAATAHVTFVSLAGFSGATTRIGYSVQDQNGVSIGAQIAIQVTAPPVIVSNDPEPPPPLVASTGSDPAAGLGLALLFVLAGAAAIGYRHIRRTAN